MCVCVGGCVREGSILNELWCEQERERERERRKRKKEERQ